VLRDPKSARAYLALGHGELRLAEDQQRVDPTRSRQTLMASREHLKRSAEIEDELAGKKPKGAPDAEDVAA
jgi:hypothetical protein